MTLKLMPRSGGRYFRNVTVLRAILQNGMRFGFDSATCQQWENNLWNVNLLNAILTLERFKVYMAWVNELPMIEKKKKMKAMKIALTK